ncbi:hypothetical protein MJ585_22330 [Klebsiella pneumoniae]|nr:hypothetical protein MJ585_22330 [Klebsiella pneumoniae]
MSTLCGTTIATLRGAGGSTPRTSVRYCWLGKHRRRFSVVPKSVISLQARAWRSCGPAKLTPQHVDAEALAKAVSGALTGFPVPRLPRLAPIRSSDRGQRWRTPAAARAGGGGAISRG